MRARSLSAAAIVVTSLACSRGATTDAGTDTGALLDATGESVLDSSAPMDTPIAPSDVGGGYGPFVGAWVPFPGVPGCSSISAVDPAASLGSPKWSECGSGRVGCRQLIVDWGAGKRRLEVGYPEPVVPGPGGAPVLKISKAYNDPDRGEWLKYGILVVQPIDDKPPILAFGSDYTSSLPSCGYTPNIGAYGIAAEKRVKSPDSRSVFWRSWSGTKLESVALPNDKLLAVPVGDTAFSSLTTAALHIETDLPRGIAVFDLTTKEIKTAKAPAIPLELPRAVAGGTVARMIGPPWGLYFVSDTGSQTQILATATGRAVLTLSLIHI